MNSYQGQFDRQRAYFRTDVTHSYEWRVDQLGRLERMIAENHERFNQALAQDFKTAWFEQEMEFGGAMSAILEAKAQLTAWMKPEQVPVPPALAETGLHAAVYREPYGVTLLIAPFNAPIALTIDPLVAILAAGNTAVIKPAETTPATAALFEEVFAAYFEPEVVAVVRGGRETVTELLQLPFDFIFFTGSTNVGKVVARAAAENLTPVLLELGGQNAAVVDQSANLADAAGKLVWGATAFAGQWCVSPGYVYVHESVAEEFVAECKAAVLRFYGTDAKASPDFSRIISDKDVQRLTALIDPAKVVVGGDTDAAVRYVGPTIMYPVTWDDAVMEREIFGPILPILTYRDLDEVITVVKDHPAGLAAYLFSRDDATVQRLIEVLPFGGGSVNQTMIQGMLPELPFGGLGTSGLGRYYGKAGFDSLTHPKSIVFSLPDVAIPAMQPPFDAEKAQQFAALLTP